MLYPFYIFSSSLKLVSCKIKIIMKNSNQCWMFTILVSINLSEQTTMAVGVTSSLQGLALIQYLEVR